MADDHDWAFITSHAAILIEVARRPDSTVRDLAAAVRLTERQTHRVLSDLVAGGYIERTRVGRRNQYRIDSGRSMRHSTVAHHRVDELLTALVPR